MRRGVSWRPAAAVGLAAGVAAACLLISGPAAAFCIVNNSNGLIDVETGGAPIPIDIHSGLLPGQRYCYVPRKPNGIIVEIFERPKTSPKRLKCRLSVPADKAEINVAKRCDVKID